MNQVDSELLAQQTIVNDLNQEAQALSAEKQSLMDIIKALGTDKSASDEQKLQLENVVSEAQLLLKSEFMTLNYEAPKKNPEITAAGEAVVNFNSDGFNKNINQIYP